MGVLTDYFLARDVAEAAKAHASVGGPQAVGLRTEQMKGIDPVVNLATLNEIVTGTETIPWIKANAATATVVGGEADEHWVFRVFPEHVAMLAGLPADVRTIAARWAKSEELAGSDSGELGQLLASLRDIAREAQQTKQQMFCWVSL